MPGLGIVHTAYDDRGRLAATTVGEDETARTTIVTYDAGYPDIRIDALGRDHRSGL